MRLLGAGEKTMKILKGYVLGVVDKGEGDKRWAIVGIKATDKDRDGWTWTLRTSFVSSVMR
ncbi:hypothetical protein AAAC07_25725 [Pseudomonas aeruginosa]